MKKYLFLNILIITIIANSFAQKSQVMFQFGGAANYYYGKGNSGNINTTFYNDRIGFELNAALGVQTFIKEKPNNIFGLFGRAGFQSDKILVNQLQDQELSGTYAIDSTRNFADFQEFEIGFIMARSFRVSFGYGWLNFFDVAHKPITINYLCATTGFSIPIGSLRWNIYLTAMAGKGFKNVTFRPSTGLVIQLN